MLETRFSLFHFENTYPKNFLKFFILSIFVVQTLQQNRQILCQNLPEFGLKGLDQVIPNTNPLCPGLEQTCCAPEDFIGLKQWWELEDTPIFPNEQILESRRSKRERQLITIKVLTHSLLKNFEKFTEKIQNFDFEIADHICVNGHQTLTTLAPKFYKNLADDYLSNIFF